MIFPVIHPDDPIAMETHDNFWGNHPTRGLTKREFFASQALQGIVASLIHRGDIGWPDTQSTYLWPATEAVIFADALIAALNNPNRKEVKP